MTVSTRRRMRLARAMVMLVVASASVVAGCNIVSPAAYLIGGTGMVEAEHDLLDVPTVVFVDDRANVVNPISLRRAIADRVSQDLMSNKAVTVTISPQDALAIARQQERANQIMSIEDIGRAVGAKQVIYVQMLQFQDTPDGTTPRPISSCKVKVIDVEQRVRVYPAGDADEDARQLQTVMSAVDTELYRTRAGRLSVFSELAATTGRDVGRLFYKHEPRAPGKNLNPR